MHTRDCFVHFRLAAPASCLLVVAALTVAGCSSGGNGFSEANAKAHVERLAGAVGSRPAGTEPNRKAREYIVGQLESSGFEVRIQEADAERPGLGVTARVANIVATRAGARRDAIALMAHYDSVPDGPGAADDGLGVAVCLEAGRVLAERPAPVNSLVVVLSDGEEFGLLGASALLKDPVRGRIRAILNFEAIGSGAPVLLFETGRASGALVAAWARHAPRPSGASFMSEIYRLISLGGDRTDLGLFKRAGFAGLDFASVGDGYTYHTPLDAPGRLDAAAVRQAGENAVATALALDGADLSDRGQATTYFDLLGLVAIAYGHTGELVVFAVAILGGLMAWVHVIGVLRRAASPRAILLTIPWALAGIAAVAATMYAAAWLVRATRAEFQPWYAHPARFFAWLTIGGLSAAWLVVRVGRLLPRRLRGSSEAASAWALALPAWIGLAVLAGRYAPASAFLAAWPLIGATVALLAFPVERSAGMRAASGVAAVSAGVLWLPSAWRLLHFAVPELDRAPLVTPLFIYPALLLVVGVFVAPPLLALLAPAHAAREWGDAARTTGHAPGEADPRSGRFGLAVLGVAATSFVWCWSAPAYTSDRPLHHRVRYVADLATGSATWETAANEPGAPAADWQRGRSPLGRTLAVDPLAPPLAFHGVAPDPPFTYHAPAPAPAAPPFRVEASIVRAADAAVALRAVPQDDGWTIVLVLPPDVIPLETNIAISQRRGRQVAAYLNVPREGVTFKGRFEAADAGRLASLEVVAIGRGLPGATWPRLPSWLPQQADVWEARSYYRLPVAWRTEAP